MVHDQSTDNIMGREEGLRRCEIAPSNFVSLLFCWMLKSLGAAFSRRRCCRSCKTFRRFHAITGHYRASRILPFIRNKALARRQRTSPQELGRVTFGGSSASSPASRTHTCFMTRKNISWTVCTLPVCSPSDNYLHAHLGALQMIQPLPSPQHPSDTDTFVMPLQGILQSPILVSVYIALVTASSDTANVVAPLQACWTGCQMARNRSSCRRWRSK